MGAGDLWLLIGNSRWHWVEALAEAASEPGSPLLRFSHSPPPPDPALLPWERLLTFDPKTDEWVPVLRPGSGALAWSARSSSLSSPCPFPFS